MPVVCTLPTQPPRRTPPLSLLLLFRLWIITSQPLRRDPHCEIERTRAEAHPVSICELRIDALLNPAGVDICAMGGAEIDHVADLLVVHERRVLTRDGAIGNREIGALLGATDHDALRVRNVEANVRVGRAALDLGDKVRQRAPRRNLWGRARG